MTAKLRARSGHRPANSGVVRLVTAHLLSVFGEWAAVIAVLVYAYERGGARATGIASVVILTPSVLGAPIAAALTDRYRALAVRQLGLGVQAAGFALAAGAIAAEMSLLVVVAATVTALGAVTLLRPTGAVLLPAVVHSSSELTKATLWISHCESASAFLGPLAAGVLLAAGSPAAALGACAVAAAVALVVSTVGAGDGPPAAVVEVADGLGRPLRVLGSGVTALRRRPRNVAVVAVVWARYLLIGALDVLVVVIAFDRLDLGTGGAGLLGALVGAGAAASIPVTRAVAGRANLTSALAIGLAIAGMSCIALGAAVPDIVVYAALPVVGLCASSLNNLGRILLQRSADPRELGAVFAFVELVAGLGLLIGSGLALVLVELLGAASAPIGVGARSARNPGVDGAPALAGCGRRGRSRRGDEPPPRAAHVRPALAARPRGRCPVGAARRGRRWHRRGSPR